MNRRILLVDDERRLLEAFAKCYKNEFDISIAINPCIALDILRYDKPYAVIVSDMRMKEMDGIEFLKKAKLITPESIRILMTGYADLQTALYAFNNDIIYRLLEKPCDKKFLLTNLNDACSIYNASIREKDISNIVSMIESKTYKKMRDNVDLIKIVETINTRHKEKIESKHLQISTEFKASGNDVIFDFFLLCDSVLFTIIIDTAFREAIENAKKHSRIKLNFMTGKVIHIRITGDFQKSNLEAEFSCGGSVLENLKVSNWLSSHSTRIILGELGGKVYEEAAYENLTCEMTSVNIELPVL